MMLRRPLGTLLLVRHGRTASNRHSYVGWGNPPLDGTGAMQAGALAATLQGEPVDAIYSSPLLRAIQTAGPLAAAHGGDVAIRPAMCELHYGDYEGLPKDGDPLHVRSRHRYDPMPGGESLLDLYERVSGFSGEVAKMLRLGCRVVVVGHFWSNRMLAGCVHNMPFAEIADAPPYKPVHGSILEVVCRPAGEGISVLRMALRPQPVAVTR